MATPDRELWLSQDILNRLSEPLDPDRIVTGANGPLKGIKYLEGHDVIRAANRIFGFGNWSFELIGLPVMVEEGTQGQNGTPYQVWMAHGQLTVAGCPVFSDVGTNVRQGAGSSGLEMAIKGAATDAMKRCLMHYGDQFGLVLYDRDNEYWDDPGSHRQQVPEQRQEPQRSAPQQPSNADLPPVDLASLSAALNQRGQKVPDLAPVLGVPATAINDKPKLVAAILQWAFANNVTDDPVQALLKALPVKEGVA